MTGGAKDARGKDAQGATGSDAPPPSSRGPGSVRYVPPSLIERWMTTGRAVIEHFGQVGRMTASAFVEVARAADEGQAACWQPGCNPGTE